MTRLRRILLAWLGATAVAEMAGIAVVSVTYAAIDRSLLGPAAPWILGAGAFEGLCLGGAQALFLTRLGVRPLPWVALTVAGAALGYALSLAGGAGGQGGEAMAEPPLWMLAGLGALAGLGMGVVMGAIQSLALRRRLPAGRWVLANALGWMPAMAAIMIAAGVAAPGWPLWTVALSGGAAGFVAGACVGVATGFVYAPAAAGRVRGS